MDYTDKQLVMETYDCSVDKFHNHINDISDVDLEEYCRVFFDGEHYESIFYKEAYIQFHAVEDKDYISYRRNILYASILKINSSFFNSHKRNLSFKVLLEFLYEKQREACKEYARVKLVRDYNLPYPPEYFSYPNWLYYESDEEIDIKCPTCKNYYTVKLRNLYNGGLCVDCRRKIRLLENKKNQNEIDKQRRFLSRINKEINSINGKYHYLYIMFDKKHPDIKIGISKDPLRRSKELSEDIDYNKSICVAGGDRQIRNAERAVHCVFYKYNKSENHHREGHTEWFCVDQFENILKFLKDFFKLENFSHIKETEEHKLITLLQRPEKIFYKIYSSVGNEDVITEIREDKLRDPLDTILLGVNYGDVYMVTEHVTEEKLKHIKEYKISQAKMMMTYMDNYITKNY